MGMKRNTITEIVLDIDPDAFCGTIEDLIKKLQTQYLPTDRLEFYQDWNGYQDGIIAHYTVLRDRLETDKELQGRKKFAAEMRAKKDKEKKQQEERERAEYDRLKKKFEKGNI